MAKSGVHTKNLASLTGSNIAVQGLRFLTMIILARRLGQQYFGYYNYILLLLGYGTTAVEFGFKNLAIREFAQNRGSQHLIFRITALRLVFAVISLVAVTLLLDKTLTQLQNNFSLLLFSCTLLLGPLIFDYLLIAKEELATLSLLTFAQAFILFVGVCLVINNPENFSDLAGLYFLSFFVMTLGFIMYSRFWEIPKNHSDQMPVRQVAISGIPFFLVNFFGGVHSSLDTFLLGQFRYESWLGYYGAATKLVGMSLAVVHPVLNTIQPRVAKLSENLYSPQMRNLLLSTMIFLWIPIIPLLVGCWLFGDQLISLVFGSEFVVAGSFLKPLSLSLALFALSLPATGALFLGRETDKMLRFVAKNMIAGLCFISLPLIFGKPDLVPWGMVASMAIYFRLSWGPYHLPYRNILNRLVVFLLPTFLLVVALQLIRSPIAATIWGAMGYLMGLYQIKIWQTDWFKTVLGKA